MSHQDTIWMQEALSLAMRGKGRVSPNPCVGCVIVKGHKIVGSGFHAGYGGPHAEVMALRKAGKKARGATVYLTLEPCNHWGKTPPCAPLLVKSKVKKVFLSTKDPNPKVAGKGVQVLKSAGIKVNVGLERDASINLNRPYFKWIKKGLPYTILKAAMTLDGKIATSTGDSKWISSPQSRNLVHKLRSESDAILIGATTANKDNPHLTSHGAGRNPLRVVVDPHLRTSPRLRIYNDHQAPTLICTSRSIPNSKTRKFQYKGVQIAKFNLTKGRIKPQDILIFLSISFVSQLLIEGGGETAWEFLRSKTVDEILYFVSPKIIGGKKALPPVSGSGFKKVDQAIPIQDLSAVRFGEDVILRGQLTS